MDRKTARYLADALTWARIASVVPITALAWYGLKWWVFWFYIAAALTDLFDGYFARRGAPPASNTDLDGLADLLFSAMTLLWFWLLIPGFYGNYWFYFPALVALELYMIPQRVRNPELVVPHLPFGRFAMALFMFLLPVLIVWGDVIWFGHLVLIVGTASKVQLALAIRERVKERGGPEPS